MADPEAARRLYRNARREALVIFVFWAVALVWTVGYCWLFGYAHDANSLPVRLGLIDANPNPPLRLVLGFPDWIAYGIVLPWVFCTVFTIWFGRFGMTDDDLGAEAKDEEEAGHGH